MPYPYDTKDDLTDTNLVHHDKANGHHHCYRYHHPYLGPTGHPLLIDKALQVVPVELGALEPEVKLF